ncbi:uncharacterized protein BDZ99DRAFT_533772 [Mytilinidion resinicola]|uniref:Uncharacterized protein n=1 Tax=Mytilinidion resinicola TaxID=574789 RepID=A0A6A6YKU1_9PEZI|nr:uncharacterized protein BDZ99DRAFT_533772 [Mytilinidion resinicola]KAF2809169.1 hypothetical protein BDZ99DRAFT_533772 [Mytilinidion resinicola]
MPREAEPSANITNAAEAAALDCKPFVAPRLRSPDVAHWDPRPSSAVAEKSTNLSASVDGSSFGLPASVGVVTEYSTKADFGAVLMCDGDVIVQGYDVRKPFERWVRENKEALAKVDELREHGIVISTWTYLSESVHLNVWQNSENTCLNRLNDGKRVVFFTDVKCVYRWLGRMSTKPESEWRGGEKFLLWDPESQDAYEGEVDLFGRDFADSENESDDDDEDDEDT